MALKNKRSQISIDVKCKILAEIDKKKVSKAEVARMFGIQKSTLFTILKSKDKILAASNSGCLKDRIRARDGKFPLLEKALMEWLQLMRSSNIPIDGNLLKEKAKTFAEKMNIEMDFKASNGWFEKFKDRNGLSFRKLCGESAAVDIDCVNGWRKEQLKQLVEKYDAEDIFNADETGLYFKMLPEKSLVFKGQESGNGGKRAKQRITVLLGANMTGSEKLPLLVIGKSSNPRCFKGVKSLPTAYKNNTKAWMTSAIFEEWIRKLDRKMAAAKRNIVLIVDNCTAHPVINNLKAVKVEFLPPNVTAVLQPMDQGVIHCFKSNYRKMIVKKMVAAIESQKPYVIDVLGAMHLAKAAWNDISEDTIAHCFRHAGFKSKEELEKEVKLLEVRPQSSLPTVPSTSDAPPSPQQQISESEELTQLISQLDIPGGHLTFGEFVNVDDDIQCCEEFSNEDELIAKITKNTEDSDSEDDVPEHSYSDDSYKKPTTKAASDAIDILRLYCERENNAEDLLQKITEIENAIIKNSFKTLKQSSITTFLSAQ